jgi:hypothetical protein
VSQRYGMRRTREELQRIMAHYERSWLETFRFVRRVSFDYDIRRDSHYVTISFRNEYHIRHELALDEVRMGGLQEVEEWFRYVEGSIAAYCRQYDEPRLRYLTPMYIGIDPIGQITARHESATTTRMMADEVEYQRRQQMQIMQEAWTRIYQDNFADVFDRHLGHNKEAEDKAKTLFKSVAGEMAFKTLDGGKALPVKGSKGTDYLLHKKASFCIERPSDGARLCAVVPGVPLWDHLLGIKLMVENDEPLFLKTANVSGAVNLTPGAINWL